MKLALLAPLALPLAFLPNLGATTTKMTAQNRPSFEQAYVNPQMMRLQSCKPATLDVYFHENYLAQHSANYLKDAVTVTANCDIVSVKIAPVLGKDYTPVEANQVDANSRELGLWLDSLGLKYQTNPPAVQKHYDSMTHNGRTAQLILEVKPARRS
ncbi:hypothetical protein [Robiginitomaculum antarcticum]|uniref:hypothetical protein n=1 Tax=Robiginitomaculum antarcticum TaxID=437507 RepID=UPI00035E29D5|nr:hypothetical protein [Robiginitomaculum antarcticum]